MEYRYVSGFPCPCPVVFTMLASCSSPSTPHVFAFRLGLTSSSDLAHSARQAEITHTPHSSRSTTAGAEMATTTSRATASTTQPAAGRVAAVNPTLADYSAPPLCDQEHAMNTLAQVVDEYYSTMARPRTRPDQKSLSTTNVIKDKPEVNDEPEIKDEPEIMYSHYYMVKYLSGMQHLFDDPKEEDDKGECVEKEDSQLHEMNEQDDGIPSSVQRDRGLVDWTWISEELHRRLSIDQLLYSSTSTPPSSTSSPSSTTSSIDLYTPEMCRRLWCMYFHTKLDVCGAYDPLYEVNGKLAKLRVLQAKNQHRYRVARDTAVRVAIPEMSVAVGLTSSLTLLHRENDERFRRFGIWDEDEQGLLRRGMAAYKRLLENQEELRKASRLGQQLDMVMGRPLDPYNDAEDDFSGMYSLAAETTAALTKTWWPNTKEDAGEFRSRFGRQVNEEYDWVWIRVRYVPWRRVDEIKLQVLVMRFVS